MCKYCQCDSKSDPKPIIQVERPFFSDKAILDLMIIPPYDGFDTEIGLNMCLVGGSELVNCSTVIDYCPMCGRKLNGGKAE